MRDKKRFETKKEIKRRISQKRRRNKLNKRKKKKEGGREQLQLYNFSLIHHKIIRSVKKIIYK
jgi:hypothetical protein